MAAVLVTLAVLDLIIALVIWDWLAEPPPESVHRRGAVPLTPAEAAERAAWRPPGPFVPPPGFPGLAFGGMVQLPVDFAWTGFAILGAPGVGKSLLTVQFLDSVLDLMVRMRAADRGGQVRALVFDAKRDLTGHILKRLPRSVPVHLALPLDRRSAAWRVADDVTIPAEA